MYEVFVVIGTYTLRLSKELGREAIYWGTTQTQTQTQTKFIQQKYIQVPYQVYMNFLEIQITL